MTQAPSTQLDSTRALAEAVAGSVDDLVELTDEVLDQAGGRLRDGFHLRATLPSGGEGDVF